ncbi:hypothetical protein, partial [Sutterella wadsworthensis]|uniref:hypothetical protein n=1 Tax=Sutterella wadsworthensis TaxID=40545 RepID=UPI0030797999
ALPISAVSRRLWKAFQDGCGVRKSLRRQQRTFLQTGLDQILIWKCLQKVSIRHEAAYSCAMTKIVL